MKDSKLIFCCLATAWLGALNIACGAGVSWWLVFLPLWLYFGSITLLGTVLIIALVRYASLDIEGISQLTGKVDRIRSILTEHLEPELPESEVEKN